MALAAPAWRLARYAAVLAAGSLVAAASASAAEVTISGDAERVRRAGLMANVERSGRANRKYPRQFSGTINSTYREEAPDLLRQETAVVRATFVRDRGGDTKYSKAYELKKGAYYEWWITGNEYGCTPSGTHHTASLGPRDGLLLIDTDSRFSAREYWLNVSDYRGFEVHYTCDWEGSSGTRTVYPATDLTPFERYRVPRNGVLADREKRAWSSSGHHYTKSVSWRFK